MTCAFLPLILTHAHESFCAFPFDPSRLSLPQSRGIFSIHVVSDLEFFWQDAAFEQIFKNEEK